LSVVASLEVTTICLLWLFGLTLAGTLYQLNHSIQQTVAAFFHAWLVFAGPVPLPGAQLAFLVLGLNLIAATFIRIPWRWDKIGLIIVHIGLVAMIVGGMTQRFSRRESILVLAEGQSDTYSYDVRNWELVVGDAGDERYPLRSLPESIDGRKLSLLEYLPDALPSTEGPDTVRNIERYRSLVVPDQPSSSPVPGALLQVGSETVLLHGNDRFGTRLEGGLVVRIEPARYAMAAEIQLDEFEAEFFQGSTTPRSFTSHVTVVQDGSERQAVISMNNPLRLRETTVFQLAYDANVNRDVSIFQVVRNPLRWTTYVVSLVIAVGLLLHLFIRGMDVRRRRAL